MNDIHSRREQMQLMIRAMALVIAAVAAFSARASEYMGHKVVVTPIPIAGGKVVSLPVTDAGPVPAETRDIKIELTGFSIQPAKDNAKVATLIWHFAFKGKRPISVEHVTVTEVHSTNQEIEFVRDASPTLHNGYWIGATAPIEVSETSTPWLFEDKASIYVFRFVIGCGGKAPVELYQPAWFSVPAKADFRKQAALINQS